VASNTITQYQKFLLRKKTCRRRHVLFSLCVFSALTYIFFQFQTVSAQTLIDPTLQEPYLLLKTSTGFEQKLPKTELSQLLYLEKYFSFQDGYKSELSAPQKCLETLVHCQLLSLIRHEHMWKTHTYIATRNDSLREFLLNISHQVQREPQNTILEIEGGKATNFQPGKNGTSFPLEKNISLLQVELPKKNKLLHSSSNTQEILLMTEEVFPAYTHPNAQKYGIFSLLGEGRSNFAGSSKDRLFNIQRAADQFNGFLLAPSEELSFVEILGPVEEETGYRSELVIRNNKTEPEFGGGICQVSTTLFRAAIHSGLKVTARQNHSYPVKYYTPIGFDATIYIPRPDLKFKNNTPEHILIQYFIEGSELVFQIYGTDDKRIVNTAGPYAIKKKHSNEYLRTEIIQTVHDKNGNLFLKDTFTSSYDDPKNYPNPDTFLTEKPDDWSKSEWKTYKRENGTNIEN